MHYLTGVWKRLSTIHSFTSAWLHYQLLYNKLLVFPHLQVASDKSVCCMTLWICLYWKTVKISEESEWLSRQSVRGTWQMIRLKQTVAEKVSEQTNEWTAYPDVSLPQTVWRQRSGFLPKESCIYSYRSLSFCHSALQQSLFSMILTLKNKKPMVKKTKQKAHITEAQSKKGHSSFNRKLLKQLSCVNKLTIATHYTEIVDMTAEGFFQATLWVLYHFAECWGNIGSPSHPRSDS